MREKETAHGAQEARTTPADTGAGPSSVIGLLGRRRFAPFFCTQFLGAFNDNVFKNALIILVTFSAVDMADSHALVNLAAALFIAPFFLFSALAGQLADRQDKAAYMRRIKLAEIAIMALGAAAFALGSVPLLLAVLFLTGAQSTFFGPAKYAILPQHLATAELTAGNALVESGTFLAILLGTIAGGILVSLDGGEVLVALTVVVIAVAGYLASRAIPPAPPAQVVEPLRYNLARETVALLRHLGRDRTVFLCVLGISWFWFLGTVYLTQFPGYTRLVLGGDATVATFLLALFSVGIGLGSFLCERLSRGRIEAGLVPLGAIGMTVFGLHLGFYDGVATTTPVHALDFVAEPGNWRVIADLVLISLCGGLYIVPLYTLVQHLSEPAHRARVIAANNVLNAAFMVAASLLAIAVLGAGATIGELFLLLAVLNALVAAYIFTRAPEFVFRMLGYLLVHSLYRIKKQDLSHIPRQGPALLVCNHVSFADAVIVHALCPRRSRFVMDADIYRLPVLNWLFRAVGAIPVTDPRIDRQMVRDSYDRIAEALANGELVCIFPEGGITRDGEIGRFKNGVEKIIRRNPVPVVPVALRGLWGSFFSYAGGRAMRSWPRRLFARITILADAPVPAEAVSAALLRERVAALRGDER